MAKKNNPKAEKAKRNLEYARLHRKKQRPFGRGRGGPRPSFGDRPAQGEGAPGARPAFGERPTEGAAAAPAAPAVPSA